MNLYFFIWEPIDQVRWQNFCGVGTQKNVNIIWPYKDRQQKCQMSTKHYSVGETCLKMYQTS
jgi:hypothetical protein